MLYSRARSEPLVWAQGGGWVICAGSFAQTADEAAGIERMGTRWEANAVAANSLKGESISTVSDVDLLAVILKMVLLRAKHPGGEGALVV